MKKHTRSNKMEVEALHRSLNQVYNKAVLTDKDIDEILKIERILNEKHRINIDAQVTRNDVTKELIKTTGDILKTSIGIGVGWKALTTVLKFEETGVITSTAGRGVTSGLLKVFKLF